MKLPWRSRTQRDEELDEEIQSHLQMAIAERVARGESPKDAEHAARREFGNVIHIGEVTRDAWGGLWFDRFRQDVKYAVRRLQKAPGFTTAVVLTLALGIGVNAAMFGIVDRLLFRAPAFMKNPGRVHRVYLVRTLDGRENHESHLAYTRYQDLARWTTSFDVTAAMNESEVPVDVGEDAREMRVAKVSASYWSLFDVRPVLGRLFTAAEDTTPTGAAVAVLSHAFWQSRYGGRADALGRRLKISKIDYEIVGVLPAGFNGASSERMVAVWLPITAYGASEFATSNDPHNWFQKYNFSWLEMLARRRPGVSAQAATADLTNAYKRSYAKQREMSAQTAHAEIARPRAVAGSVLPARGPRASPVSKVARLVSGVAIIVMVIAAANVANLMLARAVRRRREVVLQLALGVTRTRLLSQLLTESAMLALLGGVVGLLVARWASTILGSEFLPAADSISVRDSRTLLFAGAAVLLVGVVTGLAPALQSTRGDITSSLKTGVREGTYRRSRTRAALLVAQGALSVVLLVGAGLFVRSLENVRSVRMGYDVDRLLWVDVRERGERLDEAQKAALRDRLRDGAKTLPEVENAARAFTVPFMFSWTDNLSYVAGHDSSSLNRIGPVRVQAASAEYLATMGTRLLRGRFIEPTDTKGAPNVMVVSESMARALWPGRDALGQCVRVGTNEPCTTVVGITEDIRSSGNFSDLLYYYRAIDQAVPTQGGLFVRTRGDAVAVSESIRRSLQKLMPGSSYVTASPMSELYGATIHSWRLGATMFVAFGSLALVLAAIGLYSVIAYDVLQRRHELGVRVALGAQVNDVVRLVLGEGLRLAVTGVVIGAAIALYAGKWVAPLLYEVRTTDPLVYGEVVGVLLMAAMLASLLPALRAARADPNVALRTE